MALPGETEAGSAGKQPCRGIARRAHRDDDHGRGTHLSRSSQNPIGSKDPDALKIPARRAASTLTRSARSPVPAEPAQQHLRIKQFYGTSQNAVKTQIWIAVSVYVLVAIARKRLGLEASLYQILQILSVTLFEKTPILQALQPSDSHENLLDDPNQLILFDF